MIENLEIALKSIHPDIAKNTVAGLFGLNGSMPPAEMLEAKLGTDQAVADYTGLNTLAAETGNQTAAETIAFYEAAGETPEALFRAGINALMLSLIFLAESETIHQELSE